MKQQYLSVLSVAIFPLLIGVAHAAAPESPVSAVVVPEAAVPNAEPGPAADAQTGTQRFADRCTDFTTNSWAFKAPRNFLKWLDVFTDPAIYIEFAGRSLDPQSYVRSLSTILDPGTAKNYLEWTNPEIPAKWAKAAAEPEFYTAVNTILFDPGRLMRWVMLPLDGKAWSVVGKSLDPNTWLKWLYAPTDPKTQALVAKALDPETARLWLDALGDPKNSPWLSLPSGSYGFQSTNLSLSAKPTVKNIEF